MSNTKKQATSDEEVEYYTEKEIFHIDKYKTLAKDQLDVILLFRMRKYTK